MAKYSVAQARDQLSNLIAKAEAGEEVVITRHGKPVAAVNALGVPVAKLADNGVAWLIEQAKARPPLGRITSLEVLSQIKDEYR